MKVLSRRLPTRLEKSRAYHLEELKIARDPNHNAHLQPPPLPRSHRVLDIGCGAGQTLIAAYPDRLSFGLDIDLAALQLGKSLTEQVAFVCARAGELPWANEQFDMVIARVSLPYTNISISLKEIHRVLIKGGELWMTLHSLSLCWRLVKSSTNYKAWFLFPYVLLNGITFHFAQTLFPYGRDKYTSFQTERGITRALVKNGFELISSRRIGNTFLVTAKAR